MLTIAAKFIQSSHQKGMSTMARARKRMATTTTMKQSKTMAGKIHDSSTAGLTPHKLLVTFVAAVTNRKIAGQYGEVRARWQQVAVKTYTGSPPSYSSPACTQSPGR